MGALARDRERGAELRGLKRTRQMEVFCSGPRRGGGRDGRRGQFWASDFCFDYGTTAWPPPQAEPPPSPTASSLTLSSLFLAATPHVERPFQDPKQILWVTSVFLWRQNRIVTLYRVRRSSVLCESALALCPRKDRAGWYVLDMAEPSMECRSLQGGRRQ